VYTSIVKPVFPSVVTPVAPSGDFLAASTLVPAGITESTDCAEGPCVNSDAERIRKAARKGNSVQIICALFVMVFIFLLTAS
jgi:hypothetical protein